MHLPRRLGVCIALLAAIPLGCGGTERGTAAPEAPATEPKAPAQDHQVTIDNFRYNPPTLVVTRGSKVTWVNQDDVPHTVTSTADPRAFDSKALDTDGRFSQVFEAPGTYEYFCAVHPKMTARIIVK